jgi:DNA repair ATPase RecN
MHMAFLQAQVPHPKEITDYKRSTLEFYAKQVHPADQMDLHRQTGEMVLCFNIGQCFKSLEELVLKIGYDPSNVKVVEELLKKKNADIASLRKQLKFLATEDSQTKEMVETEGQKEEMLKLIMEHNAQIKEMEAELEKLVKEKEQTNPMEVIPLSAVPLTGVSTVTTSATTTAELSSSAPVTVPGTSEALATSMEKMTLQGMEIKRLEQEIENLQKLKSSFQASYNTERHTSEKLKKEIQAAAKENSCGKNTRRSQRDHLDGYLQVHK